MASGKAVSANFGGPYLETPAADRDVRGRFPAYLEVDKNLRYFFPRSLHAIISPKSAGLNSSLYKKSLAQEEGYGACFSREGSAEVKSENRS